MSKEIEKLDAWNMDAIILENDCYDMTLTPDLTRDNLIKVIDKQNEIIEALNGLLADK